MDTSPSVRGTPALGTSPAFHDGAYYPQLSTHCVDNPSSRNSLHSVETISKLCSAHATSASASDAGGFQPRTSILPVTAAEMRAVRRSCKRSMPSVTLLIVESNDDFAVATASQIPSCSSGGGTTTGISSNPR